MKYKFYYCNNLISLDLSNFNTSSVTSMTCMFQFCYNLISFNISNLLHHLLLVWIYMFMDFKYLIPLDLSNLDTSSINSLEDIEDILSGVNLNIIY